jgi:putative transposase
MVRFRRNRFGTMFAVQIRKLLVQSQSHSHWTWHLAEAFVKISGELHWLWRSVDHGGEVLAAFATRQH